MVQSFAVNSSILPTQPWLTIDNDNSKEQGDMSDDRQSITLLDIHGVEQKTFVQREGVITKRHNKPCVSKRAWIYRQLQGLGLDWDEAEASPFRLPYDQCTDRRGRGPYTTRVRQNDSSVARRV
jgi:hypothetical protein